MKIWKNFFDTRKRNESAIFLFLLFAYAMTKAAYDLAGFGMGAIAAFVWLGVVPFCVWVIDGKPE